MNNKVVIVAAKRTPVGNFCGGLSKVSAAQLGAIVIEDLIKSADLEAHEISEVIMGQVLTAGCGQNPARQAAILAGIPNHVPGFTINKVCGSGLKSVVLGYQAIALGYSDIIIAGGQESMSLAPHSLNMRVPVKTGNASLVDTMIFDGLTDVFNGYHMGITAENIAKQYKISRAAQDTFALESQRRTAEAQETGKFENEIVPVTVKGKKETVEILKDEFPRNDSTLEALSALKPAFAPDGTVTAGNASGINDGAAGVLLMSAETAERKGLAPMAYITSCASSGVDPAIMGIGPVWAIKKAISEARITWDDLGLIELNEAFAAQSLAVMQELNLNHDITNVNGGAISLGHPIGASGARCLVTLLHEADKRKVRHALVSLCIGGGMGIAMCVSKEG